MSEPTPPLRAFAGSLLILLGTCIIGFCGLTLMGAALTAAHAGDALPVYLCLCFSLVPVIVGVLLIRRGRRLRGSDPEQDRIDAEAAQRRAEERAREKAAQDALRRGLRDGARIWKASYIHGHPTIAAPQAVVVGFAGASLDLLQPRTGHVLGRIDLRSLVGTDVRIVPKGSPTTSDVMMSGMLAGHRGGALVDTVALMRFLETTFDRDKIFVHLQLSTDGFAYAVVLESEEGEALVTRINRERVNLPVQGASITTAAPDV